MSGAVSEEPVSSTPPGAERPGPIRVRPSLQAAVGYLLLVFLWAPDAFVGRGVFWHHDLRTHHHPWRSWAAETWLSGELPAWCAGIGNGYPLLADGQTGVFYAPTMLLFMLLPGALALSWAVLLHMWWAGFGTWLLARALGRSHWAAFLAGVLFSTGGFLVTHTLYLGMQNAVAWLPFTLFATLKATGGRPRWWPAVAVGLAMMLVAGHPQAAAFAWLLVGLFFLSRLGAAEARVRAIGAMAVACTLAALMGATQVVASLELAGHSTRQGGVEAIFAGIGSLPPQELVNGFLPRFFGFERPADMLESYHHRAGGYWGQGENHWEMAFYVGIPTLFLLLAAFRSRRDIFWKVILFVSLVLMLGRHTPLWGMLRTLPGLDGFRFPVRFSMWFTLAAALLAAGGLDSLLEDVRAHRTRPLARFLRIMLAILLAGLAAASLGRVAVHMGEVPIKGALEAHYREKLDPLPMPPDLPPLAQAAFGNPEPGDPALIPQKVSHVVRSMERNFSPTSPLVLWPAGQWILLLGGLHLLTRRRLSTRAFTAGAISLLAVDLYSFGGDYNPRVPRELAEAGPSWLHNVTGGDADTSSFRLGVVDRRAHPALDVELATASLGLLHGLQDVIATSPLMLLRNELMIGLAGLDLGEKGRVKAARLEENLHIASMMGVRYLVSVHKLEHPALDPLATGAVGLWENRDALPLAYGVGCVRPVEGAEEALERLPQVDPRREALVEAPPESLPPELLRCAHDLPPKPPVVDLQVRGQRERQVLVETDAPAFLVLAETAYPGWLAWVDGEPAELLTTNLAFKGLALPAGARRVTVVYAPPWLPWSNLLMVLGLLGSLMWWGAPWRRRDSGGAEPRP